MTDTRKKTSMSQVLADIKPYITKKFMAAPCINNVLKSGMMMLSRLVDTFFSRTSWTMLLYAENHSISVA